MSENTLSQLVFKDEEIRFSTFCGLAWRNDRCHQLGPTLRLHAICIWQGPGRWLFSLRNSRDHNNCQRNFDGVEIFCDASLRC